MNEIRESSAGGIQVKSNVKIAATLLALSAFSWVVSYYLMMDIGGFMIGSMDPMSTSMLFSSSFDPAVISLFLLVWTVGMVAMMFPAMIPVVSIYSRMAIKSGTDTVRILGTPVFLVGYLAMYTILGLVAYLCVSFVYLLASTIPSLTSYASLASGAVLVAAGLWQLTPFKDVCLKHCSSPLGFFLAHAKGGVSGALRMGTGHGYYCVGCCWLYMIVMLAVAAMSIPAMIILAVVITLEKAFVKGAKWFSRLVGAGFISIGLLAAGSAYLIH